MVPQYPLKTYKVMKINQLLSQDSYYNSHMYGLTRNGFTKKDIENDNVLMLVNVLDYHRMKTSISFT